MRLRACVFVRSICTRTENSHIRTQTHVHITHVTRANKGSGRSYHVKFSPPKSLPEGASPSVENMLDDETGEALYQRADDTKEALVKRLSGYHSQTVPILDHYRPRRILRPVNANQKPDDIWTEIKAGLNL